MIRGTTPTLVFTLPFETKLLTEAWITLAQNDNEVLNKELSDCEQGENTLTVRLTQADTLSLKSNCFTQIQVRAKTVDGNALASKITTVNTDKILRDGEI